MNTKTPVKRQSRVPLYQRIQKEISEQITSSDFSAGDPLPTRHELARRYNTTRATVDRAMQGLVTSGLIIGGSGRRTSVTPSGTQAVRSVVVAWSDSRDHLDLDDYFFGPLALGIHHACADFKIKAHFRNVQPNVYLEVLGETKAQGVLTLRSDYSFVAMLEQLRLQNIAIISVPGALEAEAVPSIASDNFGGVDQAIDHLVSLGHRDIAFVSLTANMPDHFERLQGFLAAMGRHNLNINPRHIHATHEVSISEYNTRVHAWLKTVSPSAILVSDFIMGLTVLRQLRELNRQVPRDVSLVHFDDSPAALHLAPATTVVKQNVFQLGYLGIERLVQLIRGEAIASVERVSTSLVVRESTAPPAKKK